jgi:hypothetical protein
MDRVLALVSGSGEPCVAKEEVGLHKNQQLTAYARNCARKLGFHTMGTHGDVWKLTCTSSISQLVYDNGVSQNSMTIRDNRV